MIQAVLKKIFGSRNERLLKQYGRIVREVNALEAEISRLSDEQLRAKTDEFRKRVQDAATPARPPSDEPQEGAETHDAAVDRARREALDDILPEAFAVVREAGKRVLNMRHFDVQLI